MNPFSRTLASASLATMLATAPASAQISSEHPSVDEVQALTKKHSKELCVGIYASPMASALTMYPEFRNAYLACSDFVQDYPELAQDMERRGIAGVTGKMVLTASTSEEELPASLGAILESRSLDPRVAPVIHERIRQLVRYVERIPPSGLDILQEGYGSGILTILTQQTLDLRGARRQQELREEGQRNERIVASILILLAWAAGYLAGTRRKKRND